MRASTRIPAALLTYVGWTFLTLFGMRWASDGAKKPLIETVTHGVSWNLAMAVGLLVEAVIQSVAAFMSGILLIALLIRTGSIWVPVVYHALWDFGTFVTSSTGPKAGGPTDFAQGWTWALPILIVLPNFLYALFLLRKVRNDTLLSTDPAPLPQRG